MIREHLFAGPSGWLRARDRGHGSPCLLLIHALAGGLGQWDDVVERLEPDHRVIALDLRGHGASQAAGDPEYSVEGYAADVGALVDALGLRRFVLVGHSMGANVAAAFAAEHPFHVTGLVLLDGGFAPESETTGGAGHAPAAPAESSAAHDRAWAEGHWSAALEGSAPGVAERVLADLAATPADLVAESYPALLADDPVAALRSYGGRTAFVSSEAGDSPAAPHLHLEDVEHAHLVGTSHWLHLDAPDRVAEILQRFIEERPLMD